MAIAVSRNLGMILLSIYLVVVGLQTAFGLKFEYSHYVVGGLAIAAGVVILIKR